MQYSIVQLKQRGIKRAVIQWEEEEGHAPPGPATRNKKMNGRIRPLGISECRKKEARRAHMFLLVLIEPSAIRQKRKEREEPNFPADRNTSKEVVQCGWCSAVLQVSMHDEWLALTIEQCLHQRGRK